MNYSEKNRIIYGLKKNVQNLRKNAHFVLILYLNIQMHMMLLENMVGMKKLLLICRNRK